MSDQDPDDVGAAVWMLGKIAADLVEYRSTPGETSDRVWQERRRIMAHVSALSGLVEDLTWAPRKTA